MSASNLFDIKSTALDLLTIQLRTTDLAQLETALRKKFNGRANVFACEPAILSFEIDDIAALDLQKTRELLAQFGLNTISLKHPNPKSAELALSAHMNWIESESSAHEKIEKNQSIHQENYEQDVPPLSQEIPNTQIKNPNFSKEKYEKTETLTSKPLNPITETMFINKPIRTGQQIYTRGDLVVLATVNAGAEIIADGNIHIYAPLRGRAIAGAHGNDKARIFTRSLEAELVSIAGVYRTFESAKTPFSGKHTQVYLQNNKIVVALIDAAQQK